MIKMKFRKNIKIASSLILIAALLVFLLFVLVGCAHNPGINVKANLIVNGQQVGDKKIATIYQHGSQYYASIPLTAVISALGYEVRWTGIEEAQFEIDGNVFYLNGYTIYDKDGKEVYTDFGKSASSLGEDGPPGEQYVDDERINNILSSLGIEPARIEILAKERMVVITVGRGTGDG